MMVPIPFDTAFAQAQRFSTLELRIIELARQDGIASVRQSKTRLLIRRLFGLPTPNPLANPHLESLRRTAVLAWQDRARTLL